MGIKNQTNSVKQKEHCYTVVEDNIKNCKYSIKKIRKDKYLNILIHCDNKCPVTTND